MLKRADPGSDPPGGGDERPIGELVHELLDEGKAYARAEFDVAKAIAADKARALVVPAILFASALVLALAAVTALAVGVVIALAKFIGPLGAGLVGLFLFAALGGGCGWYGYRRLERDL